jgi:hypothetical protein
LTEIGLKQHLQSQFAGFTAGAHVVFCSAALGEANATVSLQDEF